MIQGAPVLGFGSDKNHVEGVEGGEQGKQAHEEIFLSLVWPELAQEYRQLVEIHVAIFYRVSFCWNTTSVPEFNSSSNFVC